MLFLFFTEVYSKLSNFGTTKCAREKILDPRHAHEKKIETHETPTRKIFGPTKARYTVARDPRNLALSHL